jgi:hypothetical protein
VASAKKLKIPLCLGPSSGRVSSYLVNFSVILILKSLRHVQRSDNVVNVLQGMCLDRIEQEPSIDLYRYHASDGGFPDPGVSV